MHKGFTCFAKLYDEICSKRKFLLLYITGLEDGRKEKLVLWFTNHTQIPGKRTIPDTMFTEVKFFTWF